LISSGHLLDNLVFTVLRRETKDIFYSKTKTGREVNSAGGQGTLHVLVQVCESMADQQICKRETTALLKL